MNQKRNQQQLNCPIKKQRTISTSSNVSNLISYLQSCTNNGSSSSSGFGDDGNKNEAISTSPLLDGGLSSSSWEPSASSLLIISRLLRTRNTMMDLVQLSSCIHDTEEDRNDENVILDLISKQEHIDTRTLGLLLSVIYQNELCQESMESLFAKSCKIQCSSSKSGGSSSSNGSTRSGTMMQQQPSVSTTSPGFHFCILKFVLRILENRYKDDVMLWCGGVSTMPMLMSMSMHRHESIIVMQEMMDCWKMKHGHCHSCTGVLDDDCEYYSTGRCATTTTTTTTTTIGQDCRHGQDELWIPCIVFMMAFQIFKERMESKSYSIISHYHHRQPDSKNVTLSFSKDKRDEIMVDPVVVSVMHLFHWSKLLAFHVKRRFFDYNGSHDDNEDDENENDDGDCNSHDDQSTTFCKEENPLREFFEKEFDWIDAFVHSMDKTESCTVATSSDVKSDTCAIINDYGNDNDKEMVDLQDANIDNNDNDKDNDTNKGDEMYLKQLWTYYESCNRDEDEVSDCKSVGVDICMDQCNDNQVDNVVDTNVNLESHENTVDEHKMDKTYVIHAIALRSELLKMSKNAISQEITVMTEKIITLLDDAGSTDSAMGIELVASTLATGNAIIQEQQLHLQGNVVVEELDHEIFPISDALLASVVNRYVTEEMSSTRICSFLGSFVLPSITALARKESRPPSRQLVTMLMNLARDRPCEVMSALVIPTVHGTTSLTTQSGKERGQITKGQSELITRLMKSKFFSTTELSKLASELVHVEWTDHSIVIFVTCLQKKPSLSSATFSKLVERMCLCCDEKIFVGSTNYSSFFHIIVTKYCTQMKQEGHVECLLLAANSLTTFLKKTIISTLTKLQGEG